MKRTKAQRAQDANNLLQWSDKGFSLREIADRLNKDRDPKHHITEQTLHFQLRLLNKERDQFFRDDRLMYWSLQLAQLNHLISLASKELDRQFDTKTLAQLRELYKDRAELLALYRIADDLADQQSDSDREAKTLKIGFVDATGTR